jgi:hypothetical protein
MTNNNEKYNFQNESKTKVPYNPLVKVSMSSLNRVPFNPMSKVGSGSGRFFEQFTKFKNTETCWNIVGFTK